MVKLRAVLISILFLCSISQALQVKVTIPDLEKKKEVSGQEVSVAQAGQIFGIIIEIYSQGESFDQISLPGSDAFAIRDQEVGGQSTIFNNNIIRVQTITLQVSNDKPGLYKLGPIRVRSAGKTVIGNELHCRVEEIKREDNTLDGEIILPKKAVFWGESFDVTIRYVLHDSIMQIQPDIPEQSHFLVKGMREPGMRQVLRNGKMAYVYEYVVTYLPVKTGDVTIGPMPVHYSVALRGLRPEEIMNAMMSGRPLAQQKKTVAPAVHIQVKPLPKNNKKTSLVGQLKDFVLAVDKPTVQVNDPIKLQVMFSGKGNLEFTEEVPLQLPPGCKMYKAKTALDKIPGNDGFVAKTIEYVLQVNKSGAVEIPAQQLLYFDPEAQAYKTITSNAVELFLTGDVVEQPKKSIDELAKEVNDDASQKKANKEPAYIFDEAGRTVGALPWWLFVVLLLLPLMMYVRSVAALIDDKILKRFKKQPKAREILGAASKELTAIVLAQQHDKLYQFFVKTMAVLWQVHEQEVTEQVIEQRLTSLQWEEEKLKEFISYLHSCASVHFTKQAIGEEMQTMLLQKAHDWLLLLGEKQ